MSRLISRGRPLATMGMWLLLGWGLAAQPTPSRAADPGIPAPFPSGAVLAEESSNYKVGSEGIVPVSCSSCGGDLAPPAMAIGGSAGGCGSGGCGSCGGCAGGCCYPGRTGCDCCWDHGGPLGRLFGGFYQCVCCPDPCYQPVFVPLANAGFFVDAARPVTQMRLRSDFAWNLTLPDKAEWFWAKENAKGPRGPASGEPRVDYRQLFLYNEIAVERFSFFVELGYLNVDPTLYQSASGFSDMNLGTKSLLIDCDLMQVTFQFKTFIPTGNFTQGLGTGHVSLEPSLLGSLKLTPTTYLQGQLAYWFPIGGSPDYQGSVFHYHASLNHLLWNCGKDIQLIGTLEAGGYEICNGQYTDPSTGLSARAVNVGSIFNAGAGLRLSICNKIDFGVGTLFALTTNSMNGQEVIRGEFRWRF